MKIADKTAKIEFIDYGNIHHNVPLNRLSRHVMFPEIPASALRYRLEGSPVKPNGEIDDDLLDKLFVFICDQKIEVMVRSPKDVTPIICWIDFQGCLVKNYEDLNLVVKKV